MFNTFKTSCGKRILHKAIAITMLTATMVLSACGFQFRGSYLLPPELQTLYVSSVDLHGELTRVVKQHLSLNQVTVLNKKQNGVSEVRILKDTLDRRALSILPNGQVAEYELIYTVSYQVFQQGKERQNFIFELNRDYQDDPNLALAKSRELALLLSEMRKEAADRVLRSLSSLEATNVANALKSEAN